MPLIDAGFRDQGGAPDAACLLLYGPTVDAAVVAYLPPDLEKPDDAQEKPVHALIDTGASVSMIDESLAEELGLIAVDKTMVAGVSGVSEHKMYSAGIMVNALRINRFGNLLAANLKGGGSQHNVLLGRDFLQNTIMIYDGFRSQVTVASTDDTLGF